VEKIGRQKLNKIVMLMEKLRVVGVGVGI